MDHGILIIDEDDLDNLFGKDENVLIPFDMMNGTNIKTSCYGLFLVGLDLTKDQHERNLLNAGIERVDNISSSVAFHALSLMYPVDDISLPGILKVAKAILLLDNVTYGRVAEDIPPGTVDILVIALNKTLGLRPNVIEMVSDNE